MPIDIGRVEYRPKRNDGQKVEKVVKGHLTSLKRAQATFLQMARKYKEPAITAKLGDINSQIYESGAIPQTDLISSLPNELKFQIWSLLDDHADKLMLALTCKWNAATFETVKLSDPKTYPRKPIGKKIKSASPVNEGDVARKLQMNSRVQSTKPHVIPVLQRLQGWMDPRYKLCYTCLRFRLKNVSSAEGGNWGGKALPYCGKKVTDSMKKKMKAEGQRCPECSFRALLSTESESQSYKEVQRMMSRAVGLRP